MLQQNAQNAIILYCMECLKSGSEEYKIIYRSSHGVPQKKDVFKKLSNFTGKKQVQACNFVNKRLQTQIFPCEIHDISKNTYFEEHLRTTAFAYNAKLLGYIMIQSLFDCVTYYIQKQSLEVSCKKSRSQKFHKIPRKTPVPENLF